MDYPLQWSGPPHMTSHNKLIHLSNNSVLHNQLSRAYQQESRFSSGQKYSCDKCSYSTSHSGHFRDHNRTHTKEKPFWCHLCTYRSNFKSDVTKHVKLKH